MSHLDPTTGAELRTLYRQAVEADAIADLEAALAEYRRICTIPGKLDKNGFLIVPAPPPTHRSAQTAAARAAAQDAYAAWLLPQWKGGPGACAGLSRD